MNINERFLKILEHSGFSASEFADEIDVQRSNISHIISGRNKPSLEFIIKIKNRFPEINWDWLILGNGTMLIDDLSPTESLTKKNESKNSLDLFTLLDDDYKNEIFINENNANLTSQESDKSLQSSMSEKITDSQRLEIHETIPKSQGIANEIVTNNLTETKIKKIVFFYENGKFETFEP